MLAQLQTDVTGGGVLALVVTLAVAWLFYAVTLHLAATFFIGEVPSQRAAYAGAVPAVVSILLGRWGIEEVGFVSPSLGVAVVSILLGRWGIEEVGFVSPSLGVAVVLVATLVADAIAISSVYRISWRPTAALTLLHLAFATVLGVALNNVFGLV